MLSIMAFIGLVVGGMLLFLTAMAFLLFVVEEMPGLIAVFLFACVIIAIARLLNYV